MGNTLTIALTNPDLGFESRQFNTSVMRNIEVALLGDWWVQMSHSKINVLSYNGMSTVIQFSTIDGLSIETILVDNNVFALEELNEV